MTRRVVVDLQGAQTHDHRDRGVGRYVTDLAGALARDHADRIGAFLLDPDLNPPGRLEPLVASGKLAHHGAYAPGPDDGVYHVMSPFELDVPLRRLWPPFAHQAGMRLVVTLYDLIPEVFADHYLADPGVRRRYRAREQLVRSADRVLTISRATADDAVALLGLDPAKVVDIGGAVGERFAPPASREGALAEARAAVPHLEERFVLYTAGIEHRKNLERLVEAYAALPVDVRDRYQLVVACRVDELERHHYEHRAIELGMPGRVLLTGFVPEPVLVLLNQAAELAVFPSLYEGLGLPVLEALACGTPAIGARASAVPELLEDRALFDPTDVADITGALRRALTDPGARRSLLDAARTGRPTWAAVATRTAEVYADLGAGPPRSPRRRSRREVAVVTPLPPQPSGVARYSHRLLSHLRTRCDVDVFADGVTREGEAPGGLVVRHVDQLDLVEAADGPYERVLACVGNSVFHAHTVGAVRRRPAVVLAHDVRLVDLYQHAAHRPRSVPEGFHAALRRMYGDRVPGDLGAGGFLTREQAERWAVYMARELISASEGFLVHSEFAAGLARLDAEPAGRSRVDVLPFALPDPVAGDRNGAGPPLLATFGIVNEVKQNDKLVAAAGLLGTPVDGALVGPAGQAEVDQLRATAAAAGVAERLVVTDEVSDADYDDWLGRTTVAVQLRAGSNGESSATVGDCLAHGIPTVVTAIGWAGGLPDDCVVKVEPDVAPAELAAALDDLLADGARRRALSEAGRDYARASSFAMVADRLAGVLLG